LIKCVNCGCLVEDCLISWQEERTSQPRANFISFKDNLYTPSLDTFKASSSNRPSAFDKTTKFGNQVDDSLVRASGLIKLWAALLHGNNTLKQTANEQMKKAREGLVTFKGLNIDHVAAAALYHAIRLCGLAYTIDLVSKST
jgi:transcription initiation factor TFIIIB Brf1 subunit/transcription initiation factor TFIIB